MITLTTLSIVGGEGGLERFARAWPRIGHLFATPGEVMTPALDLLKKVRAEHRIHSYEHDPKAASYGLEAAEKLGLDPAQVFKTLLASSEKGELLVAVVPVVGSLDLKALAHAAGVKKVEMADPAAAQRSTGYLLGGISPLGQKKRLRTFIDVTA